MTIAAAKTEGDDADLTLSPPFLTFTTDDWSTAQTVTVSAAADDDTAAGTATITHSATSTDSAYNGITIASLTATENDDDTVGVTVTPKMLSVTEESTASYTVVLDTLPTGPVTVSVAKQSGGDPSLTVSATALTFTTDDWSTAQTVMVSAAKDVDSTNGAATFAHSASGADYGSVVIDSVTATESDNDTPGVTVNPEALSVTEGSTASYTVALTTQPTADVTVSLSRSGDSDLTVSTTALTFTTADWSTAQTVTVTAADDDDAADGRATIAHTASSADSGYNGIAITIASVTATEDDDDTVGVTVDPETLTVTEESTAAYTVVLDTLPTGAVTVSVAKQAGGDDDLSVDPAELTFTTGNWNTAQTVTVSAADDADTDDGTATIAHTASGGGYDSVSIASVLATEDDNDEPNAAPTFSSAATFSVAENAPAVGTVAAADADASDSITGYALAGGADQAQFSIDTNTGALTFKSAPNFEAPTDAASTDPANDAGNNEYIVVVRATGGAGDREMTADQTITVTVTDEVEAPAAPATPTISAETATGFTVTWTAPANTGPAITDYAVQYREGTSGAWTNAGHSGTTPDRDADGPDGGDGLPGSGPGNE